MIVSRTPLRMSFVGGGSDLPNFYREHGGAVLSTAIDRYVYVSINRKFDNGIRLAYSKTEEVASVAEIEHRLVKATFEMLGVNGGVEIVTVADIPSRGTGLGSSSAFTVGLINAVSAYLGRHVTAETLSRASCEVEIERCGEPIGKQDQYASAYGGFNFIEFNPDDTVNVMPVIMQRDTRDALERQLLIFYTGLTRVASGVLQAQSEAVATDRTKRDALIRMVRLAYRLRDDFSRGDISDFGAHLDENWTLKKSLTPQVSTDAIDHWYSTARRAGAEGGKLLGAGAGGFLMFCAPPERHEAIIRAMSDLRFMRFGFEARGSRIVFYDPSPRPE